MKKIEFDTITSVSERINNWDEDTISASVENFATSQPAISQYLLSTYEDELSEAQSEYLFFLGYKICEAIKDIYPTLPTITEEQIDIAEEENEQMLNYLADESEEGLENFANVLVEDYAQNELMEFIILAVSEDDEEEVQPKPEAEEDELNIDDDTRGIFFITLKTLVDCFDKVIA